MAPQQPTLVWQPFTPRGVAAFAGARPGRLWLAQGVVALFSGLVTAWVISQTWYPAIGTAIEALPKQAEIRGATLQWPGRSPARLADNSFLALVVDLDHTGEARSPAHLLVEFARHDVRIFSLFGYVQMAYPKGWVVAFSRDELEPGWGAWAAPILGLVALGVMAALMAVWAGLAGLYSAPVLLAAFFANRDLDWGGSWRLSGAALMPGAVFMAGAVFVYSLGACDPVRLIAAGVLHLLIGWAYCIAGVLALGRHPQSAGLRDNPFSPPRSG